MFPELQAQALVSSPASPLPGGWGKQPPAWPSPLPHSHPAPSGFSGMAKSPGRGFPSRLPASLSSAARNTLFYGHKTGVTIEPKLTWDTVTCCCLPGSDIPDGSHEGVDAQSGGPWAL